MNLCLRIFSLTMVPALLFAGGTIIAIAQQVSDSGSRDLAGKRDDSSYMRAAALVQAHLDSLRIQENTWLPLVAPSAGKGNITASMRVHGDGAKLTVEVEVIDDPSGAGNSPVHSNHVEIWFGLPDTPGEEPQFEEHDASYQRIYRLSAPRFRLFHPSRKSADGFEVPRIQFMNDSASARLRDYCNQRDDSIYRSMSEPATDFFGTIRYGLFPDNRPVGMYDAEHYHWFESSVSEQLSRTPSGIEYRSERTPRGYLITATVTPEGLRFVRMPEMSTIGLMVDVVSDSAAGPLLSSSPLRQWGNRGTFNMITLYQPLVTNPTGAPGRSLGAMGFTPIAYYASSGWRYVFPAAYDYKYADIIPEPESDDGCAYDFSAYFYLGAPFSRSTVTVGALHLDKYRFTDKYHRDGIIDGGEATAYIHRDIPYRSYRRFNSSGWKFDNLQTEFTFANGTAGLITVVVAGGYQPGQCGGVVELEMQVIRLTADTSSEVIGIYEHPCSHESGIGEKQLEGFQIQDVRWEKIGRTLIVECVREGKKRLIRITFDAGGGSYRIS
ncbi:MAG: hypothetical protein JWQ98_183 [Chlorobi bacterium]|nr:hypothetical protein [Chlorobiota bacterium]